MRLSQSGIIGISLCLPLAHLLLLPYERAYDLRKNDPNELLLLFTGDPQYYFNCALDNRPCKDFSAQCRHKNGLSFPGGVANKAGLTNSQVQSLERECRQLEGGFANRVQLASIRSLLQDLPSKPRAFVINGDLTNYGRKYQLDLFKKEWMSLPVTLYLGLGNHDYQNNINGCPNNVCANDMLFWFSRRYAEQMRLPLDVVRTHNGQKSTFTGSFAYSVDICSQTGANCVHNIQLNNRPEYSVSISSISDWNVLNAWNWLSRDLASIRNPSMPVLVNMHNHSPTAALWIKSALENWVRQVGNAPLRKVMVLFAHNHNEHSVTYECIAGMNVPHIYVGSVPKNRYTAIKFAGNQAKIFLLRANADSSTTVVDTINFSWSPCGSPSGSALPVAAPPPPQKPSQCKDNHHLCSAWQKTGFCTGPDATYQEKLSYCAKSCGLC